ncbi:hypothetical protein LTR86_003442 [Recurvomyces mirabilis]|nr:hypothetical protein LTR86_003442 [Recurvomyces mirabilis]
MTSTAGNTSTTTTTSTISSFLSLPPELRLKIYSALVLQTKSIQPLRLPVDYDDDQKHDTVPSLAQVCTLIRREALPLYYSSNIFSFRQICYSEELHRSSIDGRCYLNYERSQDVGLCTDAFRQWTNDVGGECLSWIRSLRFEAHHGEDLVRFWIVRDVDSRRFRLMRTGIWDTVAVSCWEDFPEEGISLTVADVGQIDVILKHQEEVIAKPPLTWKYIWRIVHGLFEALEGCEEHGEGDQEDQERGQEDDELGDDESVLESEEEAKDAEGRSDLL